MLLRRSERSCGHRVGPVGHYEQDIREREREREIDEMVIHENSEIV